MVFISFFKSEVTHIIIIKECLCFLSFSTLLFERENSTVGEQNDGTSTTHSSHSTNYSKTLEKKSFENPLLVHCSSMLSRVNIITCYSQAMKQGNNASMLSPCLTSKQPGKRERNW